MWRRERYKLSQSRGRHCARLGGVASRSYERGLNALPLVDCKQEGSGPTSCRFISTNELDARAETYKKTLLPGLGIYISIKARWSARQREYRAQTTDVRRCSGGMRLGVAVQRRTACQSNYKTQLLANQFTTDRNKRACRALSVMSASVRLRHRRESFEDLLLRLRRN